MAKSDKLRADSHSDKLRIEIIRAIESLSTGGGSGNATEAKQDVMIGEMTGYILPISSVEYTDSIDHSTTAGKNTVMITCVNGTESINGIVRPSGIYTYQPTMNDTVDSITVNANNGQLIIDEV